MKSPDIRQPKRLQQDQRKGCITVYIYLCVCEGVCVFVFMMHTYIHTYENTGNSGTLSTAPAITEVSPEWTQVLDPRSATGNVCVCVRERQHKSPSATYTLVVMRVSETHWTRIMQ